MTHNVSVHDYVRTKAVESKSPLSSLRGTVGSLETSCVLESEARGRLLTFTSHVPKIQDTMICSPRAVKVSVSYTHLTLPTTAYV